MRDLMAAGPNVLAGPQNPSCRFESRRRGSLLAARAEINPRDEGLFMFWQSQAHAASLERLRTTLYLRLRKLVSIPLLAGIVQGCAATPTAPFAGLDPSDASARIPAVSYH